MEQVPKIVHQRLAKAKVENHPDPNLLTAFSEKSLRERERIQVLEHLAQCRDCRDVVSLAVPELESAQATAGHSPSGWLGWPVLRWGALATCVVIVGAAVSLQYRTGKQAGPLDALQPSSPAVAAKSEQDAPVVAELKSEKNAVSPQPRLQSERDAFANRQLAKRNDSPTSADSKLEALKGQERSREEVTVPLRSQITAAAPAPEILNNAAVQPLRKDGDKEARKPEAYDAKASNAMASNEVVEVQSETAEVASAKAKDDSSKKEGATKSSGALARGMMPAQGNQLADSGRTQNQALSQAGAKLVPRWTLTSEGTLLRSLDSGKTWQTIPVADKTNFRAVAAIGFQIWVGGSGGALYHSSDAGEHWVQVKPSTNGQPLNADIIGLEFNDAQNGKLTTSNGETWTTANAGQSWQKK